ncbi:MAG: VOC family protein [Bacteroidota bacterium]
MKFQYTILYVADVANTLEFYERAFGFERLFITPEGDYGELATGETKLAFASHTLAASNLKDGFIPSQVQEKPFGIELAFTTEMIEQDFEKAQKAGAQLVAAIQEKPWGQKVGYLREINGFLIEICTPIPSS